MWRRAAPAGVAGCVRSGPNLDNDRMTGIGIDDSRHVPYHSGMSDDSDEQDRYIPVEEEEWRNVVVFGLSCDCSQG
jgi:hypothetical protein